MTDLLAGFTTSSAGGVQHLFPIFSIRSPESLVGPSSPVTVSLQQALRTMEPPTHIPCPSPVTWVLGAGLLLSQHCLHPPRHSPQKQLEASGLLPEHTGHHRQQGIYSLQKHSVGRAGNFFFFDLKFSIYFTFIF